MAAASPILFGLLQPVDIVGSVRALKYRLL